MRAFVIASGGSLNDEDIAYVQLKRESGEIGAVIAISDVGILKAPWADALASHDSGWWIAHPEALQFQGRKFSANKYARTEKYDKSKSGIYGGMNSGLFGMLIARDVYKADWIGLLGFDLHRRSGQHFFGEHTAIYNGKPLLNTNEQRFGIHIKQFDKFTGPQVINCTIGSDLKRFPIKNLYDTI